MTNKYEPILPDIIVWILIESQMTSRAGSADTDTRTSLVPDLGEGNFLLLLMTPSLTRDARMLPGSKKNCIK